MSLIVGLRRLEDVDICPDIVLEANCADRIVRAAKIPESISLPVSS